jgi:hypothetical protein
MYRPFPEKLGHSHADEPGGVAVIAANRSQIDTPLALSAVRYRCVTEPAALEAPALRNSGWCTAYMAICR